MNPKEFKEKIKRRATLNYVESVDIYNNGFVDRVEKALEAEIGPDKLETNPRVFIHSSLFQNTSYNVCVQLLPPLKKHFEEKGWLVSIKYPRKDSPYSDPYCLVRLFEDTRMNRIKVFLYDTFDSRYY